MTSPWLRVMDNLFSRSTTNLQYSNKASVCVWLMKAPPLLMCAHARVPCVVRTPVLAGLLAMAMIPLIAVAGIIQTSILNGGYGDDEASHDNNGIFRLGRCKLAP